MADSEQVATARVQMILEFLHEREMDLEDLSELRRVRLEQMVQFCQFQVDANQVLSWIRNGESMLAASFHIPNSLQEAEDLQVEHEQFQLAIEVSLREGFVTHFCFVVFGLMSSAMRKFLKSYFLIFLNFEIIFQIKAHFFGKISFKQL